MRVNDTSHNEGFDNGTNTGNDYAYDANGNLKKDLNKGILNIEYNHLNMPTKISFTGRNKIEYVYSAAGIKLAKFVKRKDYSSSIGTLYAGNFVYRIPGRSLPILKLFFQPEGYVQPDGNGGFEYVYQYTDIWRNVRLSYSDMNNNEKIDPNTEILDENNYYPFGLQHKGYNGNVVGAENNYKTYQGQELTEELDLNIHEWKYRISDPAIGRFWQVDPLASKYPYNSTYAFQENKLGSGIELEGLENVGWDIVNNKFSDAWHSIKKYAKKAINHLDFNADPQLNIKGGIQTYGYGYYTGGAKGTAAIVLDLQDFPLPLFQSKATKGSFTDFMKLAQKVIVFNEKRNSKKTPSNKNSKSSNRNKENKTSQEKIMTDQVIITIPKVHLNRHKNGDVYNYSEGKKDTLINIEDRSAVKKKARHMADSLLNIVGK